MNVILRPAQPLDAGVVGGILWDFFDKTPWMPNLYSAAETVSFCGVMIDRGWVTIAESGGYPVGFLALDQDEVTAFYLTDKSQGQGIGTALLAHAKAQSSRLVLWTFQANIGAVRFYQRHGFCETGRSGGARNEERLPDIQFIWNQRDIA